MWSVSVIERNRGAMVAASVASLVAVLAIRDYARLDSRPLTGDGAFFLLTGFEMARGRIAYLHVWNVKPPGIHLTTGVLALMSGGNRYLLYVLGNLANAVALVGSCLILGLVVYRLTDRHLPALAAGTAPLAYQATYEFVPSGIRPKYLLCLFGLLSLYLFLIDRYRLAGGAAVLAASYWQLGIVFPVAVVGGALRDEYSGTDGAFRRAIFGSGAATLVVIVPFAVTGAVGPMLLQTLVAPLVYPQNPRGFFETLAATRNMLGLASYLVVLGSWGGLIAVVRQMRQPQSRYWIVVAGVGWFLFQVLFVDLDARPDLLPFAIFSGLGVGILVDSLAPTRHVRENPTDAPVVELAGAIGFVLVLSLLVVITVINLPWTSGNTATYHGILYDYLKELHWTGQRLDSCHVYLSSTEVDWIEATSGSRTDRLCSGDAIRLLRAVFG